LFHPAPIEKVQSGKAGLVEGKKILPPREGKSIGEANPPWQKRERPPERSLLIPSNVLEKGGRS